MPVKVLAKHGVVTKAGDLVSLTVPRLDLGQRSLLRLACEQKLRKLVADRGLKTWRILDDDPVPDDVRYRLLKAGGMRCALCGTTSRDRELHIDHIRPRSRGGVTADENLQVLCDRCNLGKGNKDDTDFRPGPVERADGCAFCAPDFEKRVVLENGPVVAVEDAYPVTKGHHLVVTKRHAPDWFAMTEEERRLANDVIREISTRLRAADQRIAGFNVGTNAGEAAGQTVEHAHIHLIPRRRGDTPRPRGGVRGAIPGRMSYEAAP
jgi:diadenosine tetraphosphate (Ap4A) HIT family hydrolase